MIISLKMNNLPEWLERVYAWCDLLHAKMDTWKNAFRPELQMNDKQLSRAMKGSFWKDPSEDSYSKDRIAKLQLDRK